MTAKWHKLRQLTRGERRQLARAWGHLPLLAVAVKLCGFRRCQKWLAARAKPAARPTGDPLSYARQTARLVRLAGRYSLVPARCLPQSLLLWHWLQRAGLDSVICLGARQEAGRLYAHAWVEYAGEPLAEAADVRRSSVPFTAAGVKPAERPR